MIVAVTVLMAVLLYLDRFCISFAERYIKEDLQLTETQAAWFISLFFWSYALGQVPCGWLADRFGARGVLALYILTWSLFTALIGVAAGFASLLVMRFGCGLAQAGAYPASGSLLGKWVPFSGRGLASALVALGGRIGGATAPILTAYLMVLFVPLSNPGLLDEGQFLRNDAFCLQISSSTDNPAVRRVWNRLTPQGQDTVRSQTKRTGSGISEAAIAALNEVLRRPDLYTDEAFGKLNLPREALKSIERIKRRESLTEPETIRLNRLILEGVFPADIRKIYGDGWRPALLVYGTAGFVVAIAFWICFRNSPIEHPRCNTAERALIDAGRNDVSATDDATGTPTRNATDALPVGVILRSRSLWLSSISQFATNAAWLFLMTFLARYLVEVHQVPILERSWMAAIPPLAGIVGMYLGGQFTDSLTRRVGVRWGRAIPMGVTRFFAAAAYVACVWLDSPWAATIAFACVFFFVDLGVSAVWAFMQDVGGKHIGSILGWGNMWGNIGAALAPPFYNYVLGDQPSPAQWNTMFLVCAGLFVVSGAAALGIDARIPIEKPIPGERASDP